MGSVVDGTTRSRTDASREQAMVARISHNHPQSDAEALKALRSAFPEASLAQRVAALVMMARRQNDRAVAR